MTHPNRFDRRRFLTGAGGALLALPMLEALLPRRSEALPTAPPKRLLVIYHQDGRLMGDGQLINGQRNDWWSPPVGALPVGAAPSPMLAALQAIRDEVVTIDGIDNLVRHLYSDADNHIPAQKAVLTCRKGASSTTSGPAGASFDYVMGQRLRAPGSTAPASVVMFGTAADYTWRTNLLQTFYGASGTPPWLISPDPREAIGELFGSNKVGVRSNRMTTAQRLQQQRKGALGGVLQEFHALRARVNAADRERLDRHAEFIASMEAAASGGGGGGATGGGGGSPGGGGGSFGGGGGGTGGGGGALGGGGGSTGGGGGALGGGGGSTGGGGGGVTPSMCAAPSAASVPSNTDASGSTYLRGERDGVMMPAIIENVIQAFACDVTRVASLVFWQGDDPVFPTEFTGTSPFVSNNWHSVIHGVPRIYDSATTQADAQKLSASYGHYAKTFTALVQRLASFIEVDGSRMLDNTLVLWVSEMGYGAVHSAANLPVVLAGLGSAFPQGQGRHVVHANRRSMGDLLAHVMRLYGGSDQTFGETGTLGSHGSVFASELGWPGFVNANTPLHLGALDL